jgi:hypothetical protein
MIRLTLAALILTAALAGCHDPVPPPTCPTLTTTAPQQIPQPCAPQDHHDRPVLPAPAGLFPLTVAGHCVTSGAPRARGAVPKRKKRS